MDEVRICVGFYRLENREIYSVLWKKLPRWLCKRGSKRGLPSALGSCRYMTGRGQKVFWTKYPVNPWTHFSWICVAAGAHRGRELAGLIIGGAAGAILNHKKVSNYKKLSLSIYLSIIRCFIDLFESPYQVFTSDYTCCYNTVKRG